MKSETQTEFQKMNQESYRSQRDAHKMGESKMKEKLYTQKEMDDAVEKAYDRGQASIENMIYINEMNQND